MTETDPRKIAHIKALWRSLPPSHITVFVKVTDDSGEVYVYEPRGAGRVVCRGVEVQGPL